MQSNQVSDEAAFRKAGFKRHRVWLPPELWAQLKKMAAVRGRARDEIVRKCLQLGAVSFLEKNSFDPENIGRNHPKAPKNFDDSNPVAPTIF